MRRARHDDESLLASKPGERLLVQFNHLNVAAADDQVRVEGTVIARLSRGQVGPRGTVMSIARVVEISSRSDKSFENAIEDGITQICKKVHDVKSAWVKEQKVWVQEGKIVTYQVILKVTFLLDEKASI
jgi:flavin-binding protein dodecin